MRSSMSGNPKENQPRTEINTLGEFGLIARLTRDVQTRNKSSMRGIGDDAAVVRYENGLSTLISTDLLVEGIHFDLMYTPLQHLGYKSVVANLSDIYAMNGKPEQVTFSLAVSNRFSVEALEELYAGILHACERYGVDLIGGDTTSSEKGLVISVTAMGSAQASDIVYRNTARPGDTIFVSGDLGAAYVGLQMLEREKQIFLENPEVRPDLENEKYTVGRQLRPEARNDIPELLEELKIRPSSMIDISDGLSSDTLHICKQSGVGCRLLEEKFPIAGDTYGLALKFNLDPSTCALHGGEDYELLFTTASADAEKLRNHPLVSEIGQITKAGDGCKLVTKAGKVHDLQAQGWDGFRDGA